MTLQNHSTNKKASYYKDTLKRFSKHKLAMVGCTLLVLELLLFFLLPVFIHLDPTGIDKTAMPYSAPSAQHLLGVDGNGRDNFARFIYGGRVSLLIGRFT